MNPAATAPDKEHKLGSFLQVLLKNPTKASNDVFLITDEFMNSLPISELEKEEKTSVSAPLSEEINTPPPNFKVLINYKERASKQSVDEFVRYYRRRYNSLLQLLKTHNNLNDIISISRIKNMDNKEKVSFVGLVTSKTLTRNNNFSLTVEDLSSSIKIIINKNNNDIYNLAKEICLDEVLGFGGVAGNNVVFVNELVWPEVPLTRELKKTEEEEYALFIGDLHIGSKAFLKQEFENFIKWLNGEGENNEQREIARKVKYVFIVGDLVDGVGIYPGQEEDLEIKDLYDQYDRLSEYLNQIPQNINIFLCPGNHDAVRLYEPQPLLDENFAKSVYALPNVNVVSNPSLINIGVTRENPGINIFLYHGFSFPFYADTVEPIRKEGGLRRTDLIMKFLLKKRHLAPTHGSTLYIPNYEIDPLFINTIPDIFVTGHVHTTHVEKYRSINLLNCSCWISQTKYQEKVGLKPEPGRIILVNLKTRASKIIKFIKD
ncbi:metallophosphoesterase [Candidatus Woesearchaeota archaeon]|nr:metallophosphoesterase [Candidatus Woesearchaeota archaeon]